MSILVKIVKKLKEQSHLPQVGFSLIEFVVALAIAFVMLGLLYGSITRTYKSVSSIEQVIDGYSAIALYLERFEKDVTGAFVPAQARIGLPKDKKQKDKQDTSKKEEIKKPELSSVFLLKGMKSGAGGELSFITTSALSVYKKPASHLVRVTYKLEQAKTTGLWSLVRYESPELNYDRSKGNLGKNIRGYEVLGNIEKFALSCIAENNENKKESKASFENYNEWNSDNRKQEGLLLLPNFISCSGTVREGKKAIVFEYTVPIYAYNSQWATNAKAQAKKEEQKVDSKAQDGDKQSESQKEKQDEKSGSSKLSDLLAGLL